jgi:hypothetical protein
MSCYITSGVTLSCNFAFGGLSKIYLANYDQITGVTRGGDSTVSAIGMSAGAKFYEFQPVVDTSSLVEAFERNGASTYLKCTLAFEMNSPSQAKVDILNSMANSWLVAVVKDSQGTYWMVGDKGRGLRQIAGSQLSTGKAQTDNYSLTLTLEGNSLGYGDSLTSAAVLTAHL